MHGFHAAGAHTAAHIGNIQKNAAGLIALDDLLHLCGKHIQIGRIVAHQMIVRLHIRIGFRALRRNVQPFGMAEHFLFIESGADIHRRVDADLPAGFQLRAQQVKVKIGMHGIGLGRMICPAMMALGKQRD